MNKHKTYYIFIGTILLLIFFGIRIWNLDILPLFIDERLAIQRAESTISGDPLFFATQGKVLLPWVASLFIRGEGQYFIIRYITLMFVMSGAATVMTLAKKVHSEQVAYVALLLLAGNPMLHFHDRLALSDTSLYPLLTLFTLSLVWTYNRKSFSAVRAVGAGCLFVGALLAKATALVMLPLPLVAMVLIPRNWSLKERFKGLIGIYGTIAVVWLPVYSVMLMRGVNYFSRAGRGTSGQLLNLQHLGDNITWAIEGLVAYHGILFWILLIGSGLSIIFRPRMALFLQIFSISFALALALVGGELYYRYWVSSLPVLTVLLAISVVEISRRVPLPSTIITGILLFIWGLLALPFIFQANQNPTLLDLPRADRGQYLQNDSSGTGLRETAEYLETIEEPVLGAFIGCQSLQYYISQDTDLSCLALTGNINQRTEAINNALIIGEILILESPGYVEPDMIERSLEAFQVISRPGNTSSITIYRVVP